MSWLLPSALGIAVTAAVAAIALHLIARSRPLAEPLPTARFIPQRPVHARTRSFALTDIVLLLVRIAAVLTLGAAVAGPVFAAASSRVARIVLVDRSRSVASIAEMRDSVRTWARPGDVVIAFDSVAVRANADSLAAVDARGSLSAGLALAIRVAATLAPRNDSLELVLVSPLQTEEADDATARLRAAWPGRVRLVATRGTAVTATPPRVQAIAPYNDAVVAGVALLGAVAPAGNVRLIRGHVSSADTAWARDSGHVLVHWPDADSSARWPKRTSIDAIGGVSSSSGTLVGRFPRLWVMQGRSVARWSDGEPAAVERPTGNGCIRDVAVLIDPGSDLTLRAPFRGFVRALLAPCGGERLTASLDSAARASLAGVGGLAPANALRDKSAESSRWTLWLLFAGAGLLLLELAMRRTERRLA